MRFSFGTFSFFLMLGLCGAASAAVVKAPPLPLQKPEKTAVMTMPEKSPEKPKEKPQEKPAAKPVEKKAETKAAVKTSSVKAAPKKTAPAKPPEGQKDGEALAVTDTSEDKPLPEYPFGARISVGKMQNYTVGEEDTFLDIARHFGLGYVELRAANPGIDPWAPKPGSALLIPSFNLLPRAPQTPGIVVNLGKMRLYYFKDAGKPPITYAIGIGREGLQTPTGVTTIVNKIAGPSWHPTERMRKEKPYLPVSVPTGAANPLGTHAMYLGWPTFLIHGSNKPWGIGRRVSSGCMRLYPEDIVAAFNSVPVGTKVTVVDQPILVGWLDDGLYLEANPTQVQANEVEVQGISTLHPLTPAMRQSIIETAGPKADQIDWSTVERVVEERRGYPILILPATKPKQKKVEKEAEKRVPRVEKNWVYNP